jgi:hypothetical protein
MDWPGTMGERSTSVVEIASVSAAGFIWSMKGHNASADPTAVAAALAT